MLRLTVPERSAAAPPDTREEATDGLDLIASLRSGWWLVLAGLATGVAAAVCVVALSDTTYSASARVLYGPRSSDGFRPASDRALQQYAIDSAQLESQIQILRSQQTSRQVIDAHDLLNDPQFLRPRISLRALLSPFLSQPSDPTPPSDPYTAVSHEFDSNLDVRRLGQSYVLQVSFTSPDPLKAAQLTNAVVAAYIGRQIGSRIDNVQRSSQFERPIRELKAEAAIVMTALKSGQIDLENFPGADATVISAALPPTGPSTPRTMLILGFGATLGLLTGAAGSVFRHSSRSPIQSRRHVEAKLGLTYLGTLGRQRRLPAFAPKVTDAAHDPLRNQDGLRHTVVDLRAIRTAYDMVSGPRGGQCVAVTSAWQGEGKTQVAYGLALAFAASGRKTLLIDANPGNPTLSQNFGGSFDAQPVRGFGDVLAGDDPESVACVISAGLSLLPLGMNRGTACLSDRVDTQLAHQAFKRMRDQFDRIVLDLPCGSALPDALAIGSTVDCYILVVKAGRTAGPVATLASALSQANAQVAGVVINDRSRRSSKRDLLT